MTDHTPGLSAEAIANLLVDANPYLSCDACFAGLDEYVERRSQDPQYEDAAMRAHLTGCAACADEADALLELLTRSAG